MQKEKFFRGFILSKRYENVIINDTVSYMNNGMVGEFPIVIEDGKIVMSDRFTHVFQLHMYLTYLYPTEIVNKLLFCTNLSLKERIGFHANEMKMACFLASIGEVPVLLAEGKYEGEVAQKLNIEHESYRSLMLFLPEDDSMLIQKQKKYLEQIPALLKEKQMTHFEICTVRDTYDTVNFYHGVEAYFKLAELIEEPKNVIGRKF